jgi:hypothetical protein
MPMSHKVKRGHKAAAGAGSNGCRKVSGVVDTAEDPCDAEHEQLDDEDSG